MYRKREIRGHQNDFDGYVKRIAFHFDRLEGAERSSHQEYVDAQNSTWLPIARGLGNVLWLILAGWWLAAVHF
ncbi:MAG TPA: YccF domain-containing protein, partial [Acidimicrobiia bacterium]